MISPVFQFGENLLVEFVSFLVGIAVVVQFQDLVALRSDDSLFILRDLDPLATIHGVFLSLVEKLSIRTPTIGGQAANMTLVLTELSRLGIAMAADTALTALTPAYNARDTAPRVYHGVTKLRPIPRLGAGISVWGSGRIGAVDTDIWLRDFIATEQSNYDTMQSFAELLRDRLNTIISDPGPRPTLGFHLAGFQQTQQGRLPCFYHIHNGPSEFFSNIDPRRFNANLDRPPQVIPQNLFLMTRNGDNTLYAELFGIVEEYFNQLRTRTPGLRIPSPENLRMRGEYLRFQIFTISQIYKLSNLFPWIGGPITSLTISSEGIQSYETREEVVTP